MGLRPWDSGFWDAFGGHRFPYVAEMGNVELVQQDCLMTLIEVLVYYT